MQETSEIYKKIIAGKHWKETSLVIGTGSAEDGYRENMLVSLKCKASLFSGKNPTVGDCICAQIDIEMKKPAEDIPKQARLSPYVRVVNNENVSEWIQQGEFFIDTRKENDSGSRNKKLILRGYDAMIKAEQDYPDSSLEWPAVDTDVVSEIAAQMGVEVDSRTWDEMIYAYPIQYPVEYSCREALGFIAGMYGGCFIISETGKLRLVMMDGIPVETFYLITESGDAITFGGDRILV